MTKTNPGVLALFAVLGAGIAWLLETALLAAGQPIVIPPVTLGFALVAIGVIIVSLAVPVRRAVRDRARGRIDPFYATRVVILAKASSVSGALMAGVGAGIAFFLLSRSVLPTVGSLSMAIVTAVGGVLLLIGGLVAENMCTVPPDDEDGAKDPTAPERGTP